MRCSVHASYPPSPFPTPLPLPPYQRRRAACAGGRPGCGRRCKQGGQRRECGGRRLAREEGARPSVRGGAGRRTRCGHRRPARGGKGSGASGWNAAVDWGAARPPARFAARGAGAAEAARRTTGAPAAEAERMAAGALAGGRELGTAPSAAQLGARLLAARQWSSSMPARSLARGEQVSGAHARR
ncbi:hypothetical protein GQ55_3G422700 [Panicum hallii var. hallii]|uniref:Uncharacterized protein n=1 Tax=Panicum hallii var. hallii TaxID=1504633 RepID=A0A2T7EHI6_9POAL|nr:hypothetical protein GQ55_3G422700 [Panicum hallii var. hallii]